MSTPTENDDILDFGSDPFDGQVETISALGGDDSIIGTNFDDVIFGGDGADTITSNGAFQGFPGGPPPGGDLVYGGDGDDVITTEFPGVPGFSSSIGDTVFGGSGNDFILGAVAGAISPTDTLDGGLGNDTIDGNGGEDIINAGLGNDTVIARAGVDTVDGGDGEDTIDFSKDATSLVIDLDTGATTVTYVGGAESETNSNFEHVLGTAGDDVITGDAQGNSLVGGGGDDTLDGRAGSDTLFAGAGDDSIIGGEGPNDSDLLDYSDDSDGVTVIFDGTESGVVTGTSTGRDTFRQIERLALSNHDDAVNAFADTVGVDIDLLDGDDFIRPGQGQDIMDGGAGVDEIGYFDSPSAVTLNLLTGTGTGGSAQGDSFIRFESFQLTEFDDTFLGGLALPGGGLIAPGTPGVTVDGGEGDDDIQGSAAEDTLLGGIGDDTIEGGTGADSMSGGFGVDTLAYIFSAAGVNVNLDTGALSGGDADGDDITDPSNGLIDFENLIGSSQGDTLTGSIGINEIFGGDGADSIDGGGSGDALFGGLGGDTINGGSGDDTINGGVGGDQINGGSGRDTADYSDSPDRVFVLLGQIATSGDATGDQLSSIEAVVGSDFSDLLRGDDLFNDLFGGLGGDYLQGGDGDDRLFGGDDNDVLEGGAGADLLDGGDGDGDFFSALDATGPITLDIANISNSSSDYANDTLVNIEGYLGVEGFSNTITGSSADEQIAGGQVDDELNGGGGADVLVGFEGDDLLNGDGGADVIVAGLGDDTISGGSGRDQFIFEFEGGDNVLTDFEVGLELVIFTGDDFTDNSDITVGTVAGGGTDAVLTWGAAGAESSLVLEGVTESEVNSNFVFLVV